MNNRKKLLFFDIDGTLVGFDGKIPLSTYQALDMLKQAGHRIFICTGRSRSQVYDYLVAYGFDGIVAATGAYVEYEGKLIYHETIGAEKIGGLIGYFEKEGIAYALQMSDKQVSSEKNLAVIRRITSERFRALGREDDPNVFAEMELADDLCTHPEKYGIAEKAIYFGSPRKLDEVRTALAPYFEVTASSFENPDDSSGEVTMAGINKTTGMCLIGDYLNCAREDVIAFGDGPNDIDMLEYAGIGIAMGNAGDVTKAAADLVTDRIDEDGIYNALKKLKMI
jgi:hypothetical protein